MRKEFLPFENQIGVALEERALSKFCFACYDGDIKASITVYSWGGFSIAVDVPSRFKRSLTFKDGKDFNNRSEFYLDAEDVARVLLDACLRAENICRKANLPVLETYRLEVRASRSQALFTYDLV